MLLYLLKSGILLTLSPVPLPLFENGESKAPVGEVSLARERLVDVESARTGRVEVLRGRERSSAREVAEVREAIVVGGEWLCEMGRGEVDEWIEV